MSGRNRRSAISDQRVFAAEEALPLALFAAITDVRVRRPRWIEKEANALLREHVGLWAVDEG